MEERGTQEQTRQTEAVELERVREELEDANRKAEEYLDLLRRARADFANFKRRVEDERADQARNIRVEFILKLLPILDDFERALAAVPAEGKERDWVAGLLLIERKLRGLLEAEGVRKIEAEGAEFNPWLHEAVGYERSPELEDGRILHVVRPGYRVGDTVIRPAQVIVARKSG
ncbi:MAG: nucleotide exchange factor GrpE [Chloroflexi bacterium]|nr:nucleotide exchange factor GrpE [Chloroflexota bacterium]